jgi:hypothetical protein
MKLERCVCDLGEPELLEGNTSMKYQVRCTVCHRCGVEGSREGAIERWNEDMLTLKEHRAQAEGKRP